MSPTARQGFWRRHRLPTALAASLVILVGLAYSLRETKTAARFLASVNMKGVGTASKVYMANDSNASKPSFRVPSQHGDRPVDPLEIGQTLTGSGFYGFNPGVNLETTTSSSTPSQSGERTYLVLLEPTDPGSSGQSEIEFGLSSVNSAFDSTDLSLSQDSIFGGTGGATKEIDLIHLSDGISEVVFDMAQANAAFDSIILTRGQDNIFGTTGDEGWEAVDVTGLYQRTLTAALPLRNEGPEWRAVGKTQQEVALPFDGDGLGLRTLGYIDDDNEVFDFDS